MRRPRLAARSPNSLRSAAARSMPPRDSGDTLEHTSRRSQPSSCIRSNLRSARANTRSRLSAGMPSKSRNGWKVTISSPRSATILRTSAGVPLKESRSFSKISTPLKPAPAMASSFSARSPLRETVAIDSFMACLLRAGRRRCRIARGERRRERALHALDIGLQPGEQAKRLGRLMHAHAPARQRARPGRASGLDQLGLDRGVDDVGNPVA